MKWYVAKIIYRIICGEGNHMAQFDEQLRLFEAPDMAEALYKARTAGEAEAVVFYNQREQLVRWQFIDVSELYPLPEVVDGTELYSRIEERENGADYEAFVRSKGQHLVFQTASLQLT